LLGLNVELAHGVFFTGTTWEKPKNDAARASGRALLMRRLLLEGLRESSLDEKVSSGGVRVDEAFRVR
jgi:hypothetical protein